MFKNKLSGSLSTFKALVNEFYQVGLRPDMSVRDKFDWAFNRPKEVDGQMDIIMAVMSVIVGAVALYVGILVLSNVESSLPNETTSSETFGKIESNVDSSFVLIGVGFIVVAAGFIIGALITRLAPTMMSDNK